jgi:hypothetical protein
VIESIRPVGLTDIIGLQRYEQRRDEIRRRTIALKKHRRVSVGDCVTLVFENHDTVFFQVQEMLRAEHITDLDAVREELEVYNALLPNPGQLSATMLIEITDAEDIAARLLEFSGIDECLFLDIGSERVRAEFEPGRSRADKLSAVQYVRFTLSPAQRTAFADPAVAARLSIEHPHYRAAAEIVGETRASLRRDLGETS